MDEGSGVPEAIRATVFDPFVSSGKPNGTGLGLAIVSKIVQDHGGSVSIERTSRRWNRGAGQASPRTPPR